MYFVTTSFLILENRLDPDEMPPKAAFHLGLHCCQSACLPLSRMKRVNPLPAKIQSILDNSKFTGQYFMFIVKEHRPKRFLHVFFFFNQRCFMSI